MGEALISGAGGGTGKIYKWKRYEINEKTVYVWDKWSVLNTTTYKWNRYDKVVKPGQLVGSNWSYHSGLETITVSPNGYHFRYNSNPQLEYASYNGSVVFAIPMITERYAIGYPGSIGTTNNAPTIDPSYLGSDDNYYYASRYYPILGNYAGNNGVGGVGMRYDYSTSGYYTPNQSGLEYSKGDTSYGQVTSTNSSAYPSNGASGSYWYVSAGSTTTTSKGSTSYGQVESESSSAYPNGGAQGGYWYENRNSRIEQSIGSYRDRVYSTARNTYPDNGIQGGYWYVFEEV